MVVCPDCGRHVGKDANYCAACGARILRPRRPATLKLRCPHCGEPWVIGMQYCDACGLPLIPQTSSPKPSKSIDGPHLVVVASGIEIPLPAASEILIGREDPMGSILPDLDLTLYGGSEEVSRKHALVSVREGHYYIKDLESYNGTFVNEQLLTPNTWRELRDNDEILLGRIQFIFRAGPAHVER